MREFIGNFHDTPITEWAVNAQGSWWRWLETVVQDNRSNGKVRILCPFRWAGLQIEL